MSLQPETRLHIRRGEDCRCEELRKVFGDGAPKQCLRCDLREACIELTDEGYLVVPNEHRQKYIDCGVPTATTLDHRSWAASWAVMLVDHFVGTHDLQPLLCRCAVDPEFAEAIATILLQSDSDAATKAHAFAIEAGVALSKR